MQEDTIVVEVRAVRQAHAEQFNFDLKAIYKDIKRQEKESKRNIVTFKPKPALSVRVHKPSSVSQV